MIQKLVSCGTPWFLQSPEAASQVNGPLQAVVQAEALVLDPLLEDELLTVVELVELDDVPLEPVMELLAAVLLVVVVAEPELELELL